VAVKEKVASLFLFLGTFFNPLGYDALLYQTIQWTESFLISISIFYLLSVFCFILFLLLSKKRIFLFLAAFFLPFGYDFLLYNLMNVIGYWNSILVFYIIAASFFIGFFILSETNPIKYLTMKLKGSDKSL
jgi:hypothetical protein